MKRGEIAKGASLMGLLLAGLAATLAAAEQPVVDTDVVFRAPYTEDFEIDGTLSNPVWQEAEPLPPICHDRNQFGGRPLPCRADVRVAYSKTALYYGGTIYQNMKTCIAKWDQHDLPVWDDDNLELFLFVPGEEGNRLYQLVVNPLGSVADLRDGNINWNAEGLAVKTTRRDDRWTIEVRLPFESLPMDRPARADVIAANDFAQVAAWRLATGRAIQALVTTPQALPLRTDGTVIDVVVDAKTAVDDFLKESPATHALIRPIATGRADFDAAVNAELVKFADGKCVLAEGFPVKPPRSFARTDATGTRGKWWWLYRVRENRDRIRREGGQYDVVMLGDSITHFWHDFDYWTGGLKVWKKARKELKLLNLGYGGDNTQNLLWRLRNGELDGYRAKVFQILIGTNNRSAPEKTAADIKEIVELIKARHPESKILILSIFPREDRAERHQANQKVNAIIAGYADGKTVFHMDIGHVFLDTDGHLKAGLCPDNDKLHLKDWGYELWWNAVSPLLKELCK